MSEEHVPAERRPALPLEAGRGEPELRLELSNAGVRRVWALYSEDEGVVGGAVPAPPAPPPEDALSFFLRDLPALAWRGRWYLGAGLGAALGFGLTYLAVAADVYHVGANVLIERRASPLDEGDRLRGWSLATQAEILQSPSIVGAAVELLRERGLSRADADPEADPADPPKLPLVSATPITGTNVVALSHRTSDPAWGTAFVAALIERYGDYARSIERATPESALELVRRKEQDLRRELAARESEYQRLRGASQSFGEGSEALTVQKAMLERQAQMLVEARSRLFDLENRLAAARDASRSGLPVPQAALELQEELWRAELRLAEASEHFSDEHPEVASARRQVQTLKAQLAASRRANVSALEREATAARQTERRLEAAYQREVEKSAALDAHRLKEQELLEEIRSLRSVHEQTLGKLKTLELHYEAATEGEGGVIIRVLDGPVPSPEPVWPQPLLVLLPCAFIGLLGGLGLTLLSERLARETREPAPGRALAPAPAVLYPKRAREGA